MTSRLEVRETTDVGECRRAAKRSAEGFGFDETMLGRISIVATELANNVLRHGGGGEIVVQVLDDGQVPVLEMLAIDRGPGMRNVDECLRDGFSTGGTPGTGLGAISRLSDTFDVHSQEGKGAVVVSRIARSRERTQVPAQATAALAFGALSVPLAGETECGDLWRIADGDTRLGVLIVDGLGHGPLAAAAARDAAQAFVKEPLQEPASVMQGLHRALMGGRGAAGACARLHVHESKVFYAGVGNICGSLADAQGARGMVSHNGTLGSQAPRTQQFVYDWPTDGLVVMHSDGLSARWRLAEYPGLFTRHPAVIAGVLYRDFARKRDDATVLVMRCPR